MTEFYALKAIWLAKKPKRQVSSAIRLVAAQQIKVEE